MNRRFAMPSGNLSPSRRTFLQLSAVASAAAAFNIVSEPMLAAAGFEIVAADFDRQLYGAYTCVKTAR